MAARPSLTLMGWHRQGLQRLKRILGGWLADYMRGAPTPNCLANFMRRGNPPNPKYNYPKRTGLAP